MYLAEISPKHLRGAVGTTYQLVYTISIFISHILGLEGLLGTETKWPFLLVATILPALFQLCTLPFCPESPSFLFLNQGKELEAQSALIWLRGTVEVHEDMEEMGAERDQMKYLPSTGTNTTLKEMITNPALRMPLIIACMMMLAQHICGIKAIMFFSTTIFTYTGLSVDTLEYIPFGITACIVMITIVSLVMVDIVGRKILMLFGLSGMLGVVILLFFWIHFKESGGWFSYMGIFGDFLAVIFYASGLPSIPWFLTMELFNQRARPMAASIVVTIHWIAPVLIGMSFVPLLVLVGVGYIFLVYVGVLAFFIAFTWFKLPETKGKTVGEISAGFR